MRRRRPGHLFVRLAGAIVALILVVPTLIVVPISFAENRSFVFPPTSWSLNWYLALFQNTLWASSLQRSAMIGMRAALLATVCGTAAAIGLVRWRHRRLAGAVRAVMMAPVVIPGIVLAIGIFAAFSVFGLTGTIQGFVIAHAALGLPFVIISVTASLSGVDPLIEKAAASLGATRWGVVRQVTLPLIMPGVLAGALLAFVTSFDEILVSLFIKSPFLETFPIRMYQSVSNDTDPTVAAASTLVLVLTTTIIIIASRIAALRSRRLVGRRE
jgi:putative spermidine/putrescine transport system permease protein